MAKANETYAVWVGSLADTITETDLFIAFKKCGPIATAKITTDKNGKSRGFGFVNFYTEKAARSAAIEMDKTYIQGMEIKTSFKDGTQKKLDLRPFTDCNKFMEGEPCNPPEKKDCIFRHSYKARDQMQICQDWLRKNCLNKKCPMRHPNKQQLCSSPPPSPLKPENIAIYWDLESCPILNNKPVTAVVQRIRDVYLPGRKEYEFVCVCDASRQKPATIVEFNKSEVTIVHVDATVPATVNNKIKHLMQKFADLFQSHASILLISTAVNLFTSLADLKQKSQLKIKLLHNPMSSEEVFQFVDEERRFDHLTGNLPNNKAF